MEIVINQIDTVEVFENDIQLYLAMFCEEYGIDDMKEEDQQRWIAALIYIQKKVFPNRDMLKQHNNIYTDNTIMGTNCNSYNYDLLNSIADYYVFISSLYSKAVSIYGFSKLVNISYQLIQDWGKNYNNSNRLSAKSYDIYKKLTDDREQSLVAKEESLKHPTAIAILLNKEFGYNLPGVSKETSRKQVLTDDDLIRIGQKNVQIAQNSSDDTE